MSGTRQDDEFVPETVLKRDAFSETVTGHMAGAPDRRLALRKLDALPMWSRPVAWILARREVRALRTVQGIEGVPQLLRVDRTGILRGWSEGTPLQLARPTSAAFYRDARRLLRDLRRRGVTHNDIAKPQNWLMTPEGRAALGKATRATGRCWASRQRAHRQTPSGCRRRAPSARQTWRSSGSRWGAAAAPARAPL